ncbi:Sodium/potassium-transporting ATPase subunit alpha-A [Grifola frondosa]|uniref:Sodium/potassium-transporting ATPase subunit alpha-A n=1 Tax=Grifola frondosa TaxID=5627 RepID=A0A1C7MRC1_GRIFR|nr:Sodium/potassium-transporting ATPase subunit alpha-A [Grifola frondosa]
MWRLRKSHTAPRNDSIEAPARIPAEFRTLSIHVETKTSLDGGKIGTSRRVAVKELSSLDWHKISADEALQRLNVSPQTGLESAQAQRRLQANGKNVISPPKSNLLRKMLEWLLGGFGSLLLGASIICFIAWRPLGNPPLASNLALAVVLLIVFCYKRGSTLGKISRHRSVQTQMPAAELVSGDLVYVSLGEKVPADLRLIDVSGDLRFDRSILTGESEPVAGRVEMTDENVMETKNIALQGTNCVSGSGLGVVIQTGDNTVFGRIAKLSSMEPAKMTTLQREILHFVLIIASLATVIAVIIVILWASWLHRKFPSYIDVSALLIDIVSVLVAFVPEGLPVSVTLSLAKVASTLSKHKVLCKSLSIVETLGSVNVLCSDKTGTLTQNKMHVENVAVFDEVLPYSRFQSVIADVGSKSAENLAQLGAVSAICNAATFGGSSDDNEKAGSQEQAIIGDATDTAILRFSDSLTPADITRDKWIEVFKINFNSKTKYMLKLSKISPSASQDSLVAPIAHWDHFSNSDFLLTVKGAPEVLLPHCGFVVDPAGGAPVPLSPSVLARIATVQEKWAQDGQRVLLLARRVVKEDLVPKSVDVNSEDFAELVEEFRHDLIIVGLVGLIDPLKSGIKHTVSTCRRAGIRFFVVTGDHPTTAIAIAAQAGIITDAKRVHHVADLDSKIDPASVPRYDPDVEDPQMKSIVVTGPELDKLNDPQVEQLCQYQEIVFARTTPEQKLRIVHEFKRRENIVAMTGDGVNDAPSLKAADCGIAMGEGSDVAKEAADMVLLDDFSAIVIALEYGRLVFDNLQKTLLYLLPAGSFSELMPLLLNILIGVPQMLSNLQMILICVGTDVLPALSLCLEPPESGLLERKPRNVKTERLANWKLVLQAYAFLGVLETLCAMIMSFWYLRRQGVPFSNLALGFGNWPGLTDELLYKAQSVYFFTLVLMQWGNLFATRCRTLSIFQHTPALNCYIPWFQKVFQTRGVPVEFYFIPITFGLGLLFLDEVRKYLVRKYPQSIIAKLAW